MNCISGPLRLIGIIASLLAAGGCGASVSESDASEIESRYLLHYTLTPEPATQSVQVSLTLSQTAGQVREVAFSSAGLNEQQVVGEGQIEIADSRIRWLPETNGGTLSWRAAVPHRRNGKGFDAWLDDEWGIFRAEDVIPRTTTRTLKGAASATTVSFELPKGWSAITEYPSIGGKIVVDKPQRRFDQPSGWIALGRLGIRRETIAATKVAIAAPQGQSTRRMDMLALLNWTLPELNALLPEPLPRVTVVSAAEPMWRGGLSAPASIFLHADRPLISENATSTLLHEVVHVALRLDTQTGFDWITEGLAEYYSLELLRRGNAITAERHQRAIAALSEWAEQSHTLCAANASGATTALAVLLFRDLDAEIQKTTHRKASLDDLTAELASLQTSISLESLQQVTARLTGKPSSVLSTDKLPGCT